MWRGDKYLMSPERFGVFIWNFGMFSLHGNVNKIFLESFWPGLLKFEMRSVWKCVCEKCNFLVPLIIYWLSFTLRKISSFLFFIFLTWYEGDWWREAPLPCDFVSNSFWSVNYIPGTWPEWRCHLLSSFIKGYHWSKFQLHTTYGSGDSRGEVHF